MVCLHQLLALGFLCSTNVRFVALWEEYFNIDYEQSYLCGFLGVVDDPSWRHIWATTGVGFAAAQSGSFWINDEIRTQFRQRLHHGSGGSVFD